MTKTLKKHACITIVIIITRTRRERCFFVKNLVTVPHMRTVYFIDPRENIFLEETKQEKKNDSIGRLQLSKLWKRLHFTYSTMTEMQ